MKASKGAKQNLYDGSFFSYRYTMLIDWISFNHKHYLGKKKTACIIWHFITSALILRSTSEAMGNLGKGCRWEPIESILGTLSCLSVSCTETIFLSYYECIFALTYNKSVNPKSFMKIICYLPNPQVLHILKD